MRHCVADKLDGAATAGSAQSTSPIAGLSLWRQSVFLHSILDEKRHCLGQALLPQVQRTAEREWVVAEVEDNALCHCFVQSANDRLAALRRNIFGDEQFVNLHAAHNRLGNPSRCRVDVLRAIRLSLPTAR